MNTPETDVRVIAGNLSDAQRGVLAWLPADGSEATTRANRSIAPWLMSFARREPPLTEKRVVGRNGIANDLRYRLTPLGLAVRTHLLEQDQ